VDADHRQRPSRELGDDAIGDRVQVLDEVSLGRTGAVEERLVEVGELDPLRRLGLLSRQR